MKQTTATRPRPVDSLPRGPQAGRRRVREGLLALLGALVLLVGVPVALVMFVGNPLPTELPSRDWLTTPVTPGLVIDVLAVLVWVVWVHFLVCFLTEWRAVRAGRMPGRVTMGGGSQLLARQLVAGVLLLAGGASIAQGVTALADHAPVTVSSSVTATVTADEFRAPMISPEDQAAMAADAAESRHQQAGVKHYEVKPPNGRNHDTLWDISERTLGDPFRYHEIFQLNKDRLQPDGSRLTDADLIRPGWQLLLPADATGPGVRLTPATPAPLPMTPPASGGEQASSAVESALAGTATETATTQVTTTEHGSDHALADLLLGGGLVLAGVARALTVRRGPYGEPDEDAAALAGAAAVRRAELLDEALRGLAEMRQAQHQPMPELLFAYVNDSQVVLHLAAKTSAPERPWTVSADGTSWTLHADELVPAGRGVPAPYPSLVAVAESHGFDLLVDLEMAPGLVGLGGDVTVAREVAMSMALDLATHGWSDNVDVVMVGFADRLEDLETGRVRHLAGLDQAIAEAEQGRATMSAVTAQLGLSGVLQGRQRGAASQCTPTVVFLSGPPTAEQAQRLAQLTSGGRTSFSVVCVGDSPSARWRFVVDGNGALDASVLGVSGTARRLTGTGQQRLAALAEAARRQREAGAQVLESTPPAELATGAFAQAAARESATATEPSTVHVPLAGTATATDLAGAPAALRLLGPVAVTAPGHLDEARRDLLTEVVVMAALHPDGLHEAVLRASLWPRGVEQAVMDARLADAQAWLGSDASGRPRLERGEDGRWHLREVAVDHAVLLRAIRAGGLDDLLDALRLGTGEAFSGAGRHYAWLAFAREAREGRLLATSAARRAAELASAAGDLDRTREALRLGLGLVPTAEPLWRMLLSLTAQHTPEDLDREINQMYSALTEHGVRPEPATDALVTELAPRREGAVGS